MKRLAIAMGAVVCVVSVQAMPTKAELTKAQPLVVELMTPSMNAFQNATAKEKVAAAVKVGDASAEFAKAAETEAARFLLLKGAVSYYARGEAYDKAADVVAELQRTVKDVPPSAIAEIAGKATGRISETKAPRLYAQYRAAKLQVKAESEAKTLAAKLKKVKSDVLQRRYAEALAVSGDWKAAYAEFAKVSDTKLKAIAEAESKGAVKNMEAGEFWWAYKPTLDDADDFFKSHAATFYRQALAAGEITGLKKNIVEQRISGIAAESVPVVAVTTQKRDGLYCIVDLSGGVNAKEFPVSYVDSAAEVDAKESSLVLIKVKAGIDPKGRYSISKDYYIGVYPVTTKQWELVMGKVPEGVGKDCAGSLHSVSWNDFRGLSDKEKNGIAGPSVGSFVGRLIAKTAGMGFDLPTEAQWELANRAGIKAKNWVSGGGLWERCLDGGSRMMGKDPVGAVGKGNCANIQGENAKGECPRAISNQANAFWGRGYRLCLNADVVVPVATPSAVAAPATAVSSSGKVWEEKGYRAWLDLGEKYGKLEFVKVLPSSFSFMVSGVNAGSESQKVSIMRSYWIMRQPVTKRQFSYDPRNSGGEDYAQPTRERAESFVQLIMHEMGEALPNGYVLRLPSLAEWEYAFHANTKNHDDPYYELSVIHRNDEVARKIYNGKGSASRNVANAWGLTDFKTEKVLDTFSFAEIKKLHPALEKPGFVINRIPKPESHEDPLYWNEDTESQVVISRMPDWTYWRGRKMSEKDVDSDWTSFRLVVGPDLVSEWKAKHGKK